MCRWDASKNKRRPSSLLRIGYAGYGDDRAGLAGLHALTPNFAGKDEG